MQSCGSVEVSHGKIRVRQQFMKTIRFISLAFVATVISVSLCACGDDDDSPLIPVDPNAKHITRIYYQENNGKFKEIIYSYDSQGRVAQMVEKSNLRDTWTHFDTYDYTYGDNTITVYYKGKYYFDSKYTYTLTNGRITSLRKETQNNQPSVESYSYDEQGYLKTRNLERYYETYTWEGSFLKSANYPDYCLMYEYSNYKVPVNYIPVNLFDEKMAVLAMQGFFGKMPSHLISSITNYKSNGVSSTTPYNYEMQDGRPVKYGSTVIDWE